MKVLNRIINVFFFIPDVPSSSSWMSTPAGNQYTAASTWSATPSTWAPASQWQSTYQQTPNNAAAAIGNPFLAQAVNPQQQAQSNIFGQGNISVALSWWHMLVDILFFVCLQLTQLEMIMDRGLDRLPLQLLAMQVTWEKCHLLILLQ